MAEVITQAERAAKLLAELAKVLAGLREVIGDIPLALPDPAAVTGLASLKRYEDALDALVCAWVGVRYLAGKATAYGDETSAIWVPGER